MLNAQKKGRYRVDCYLKNKKGVSLVLLVILIIIVVIVATIAICMVAGDIKILDLFNKDTTYVSSKEVESEVNVLLEEYYNRRTPENINFETFLAEKEEQNIIEGYNVYDDTVSVFLSGYEISIKSSNLRVLEIIDGKKNVRISLDKTDALPGEIVTAKLYFGSNVKIKKCKWVYNTSKEIGTNEELYTNYIDDSSEITLTDTNNGAHYLHVLIVTSKGEKIEKVSGKITISSELISKVQFKETSKEIELYDTINLEVVTTPKEIKDTDLIWKTSDRNIVKIEGNGKVKAVDIGTAIITAESRKDGTIKDSCKIIVSEEVLRIGDYIDAGKNIVNTEETTDDWMVLSINDDKTYAILANNLTDVYINNVKSVLKESKIQLNSSGEIVWWNDRDQAVQAMGNSEYWKSLIASKLQNKVIVKGAITGEQLNESFKQKTQKKINYLNLPDDLDMDPYTITNHGLISGYWMMTEFGAKALWCVMYNGSTNHYDCGYHASSNGIALRPVIEIDNSSATLKKIDNHVWTIE